MDAISIRNIKYSKFYVLLIIFSFGCLSSKQNHTEEEKFLLQVDFQDFFNNDKVGLRVGNCLVFENLEITSDEVLGLTPLIVKIYSKGPNGTKISYIDNTKSCNSKSIDSIFIIINGREIRYSINAGKGRYVGLSKKNYNELDLKQSEKPFMYE